MSSTVTRKALILAISLMLFIPSVTAQTKSKTYKIALAESSVWVMVYKGGLLSVLAHDHNIGVKTFSGNVVVPDAGASGGSVEMEFDAQSLKVEDRNISDKDREEITTAMHNAVLESAKHQKITFKSVSADSVKQTAKNVFTLTVNGDLTLHGVTKRIAVPMTVTITDQQVRALGKYLLKQTDFGIKPYSAARGAIKVKDEISINFNIIAKA